MSSISVSALVKTANGSAGSNIKVTVQIFSLRTGRWETFASATTRSGRLQTAVTPFDSRQLNAPLLRLMSSAGVIGEDAHLKFNKTTQTLSYNFGTITHAPSSTRTVTRGTTSAFTLNTNNLAPARTVTSPAGTVNSTSTINPDLLANFNVELVRFQVKEQDLRSTIGEKDGRIQSQDLTIKASSERISVLESQLEKVKASETKLITENRIASDQISRAVPLTNLASNIGNQFHLANKKLADEKKPFQIGNIQVELRGTLSDDGQAMSMWKLSDLAKGAAEGGSAVKLDLVSQKESAVASLDVKVPDLTGLTETLAKRVLRAVGLRYEGISKSVGGNSEYTLGQVISQAPKENSDVAPNENILVVFAIQ